MARVIAPTTTQAVLVTVAAFSSGWMGWMTMYSSPDSTADTPAARRSVDGVMVMAAGDGTSVAVKALDGGTRPGEVAREEPRDRQGQQHVHVRRGLLVRQGVEDGLELTPRGRIVIAVKAY